MKPGASLIETLPSILVGGPEYSKPRASADAVEITLLVVNDPLESQEREQPAIESHALVKTAHSYNDMRDSVNLHNRISNSILTLEPDHRKTGPRELAQGARG